MSKKGNGFSRRAFVSRAGALAGAMAINPGTPSSLPGRKAELPKRVLGRTGEQVPVLALGTWPCGMCDQISVNQIARLVNEAIDLGINYIDTARAYRKAEDGIGLGLGQRRKEVFLTTKVWADTAAQARKSFETSLRKLKTDYVDLLMLHSLGNRNIDRVLAPGGALEYLIKQKEAGKARFLGITGHNKVPRYVKLIETGHIDVVMVATNFIDRYTYNFENKVLPKARERNLGIACMKVLGGMRGGFEAASGPNPGPCVGEDRVSLAMRYALDLPGSATLVIGVHTVEQLRQNAALAADYKPLTAAEREKLERIGRRLARELGAHFGPVA